MFNLKRSPSFLLSKCNQKAKELAVESLKEFNLTPAQAVVMTCLYKQDGLSQLDLGMNSGKDRTTISGIINRLVMLGYVDRITDPNDRRSTLVYLTPKAREIEEQLEQEGNFVNHQLTQMLEETEKEQLLTLLTKIWNG